MRPPPFTIEAQAPRIGALVVVSPAYLARFVPSLTGAAVPTPSGPGSGGLVVARLPLGPVTDERLAVRRVDHAGLRVVAADATRLITLTSDGPAVAAAVAVPDVVVTLAEDGGAAPTLARVAVAIGLTPETGWPEDEEGRLVMLVRLLRASGYHPHAPARLVRIFASALAINAEGDVPVPLAGDEVVRAGRVAGFGAEALASDFVLGDAWPMHLSEAERAAMPDEAAVRGLFREAARALRRLGATAA